MIGNSWNFPTQIMMMIFLMLTSRCFRLDYWFLLIKKCIQYLLCCFIHMQEWMLLSQIGCHTFLCFSQPSPLLNWRINTRYMPKELGLFYVIFLPFPLYIRWDHFITFQVTQLNAFTLYVPCIISLTNKFHFIPSFQFTVTSFSIYSLSCLQILRSFPHQNYRHVF